MKVCDRCFRHSGKSVAAAILITIGPENYDLCVTCSDILRSLINHKSVDNQQDTVKDGKQDVQPKTKKRGRPKKSATG